MHRHLLVAPMLALATLSLTTPVAAVPTPASDLSDARSIASVSEASTPCGHVKRARGEEPACNPHLADSPWPGNHRNPYAQASSPFPGPAGPAERVNVDHDGFASAPIVLSFSPKYPDGGRVIWASTVGLTNEILKIDPDTVTVIDKHIPQVEEGARPGTNSVSGRVQPRRRRQSPPRRTGDGT